jgi:hypothetical protein
VSLATTLAEQGFYPIGVLKNFIRLVQHRCSTGTTPHGVAYKSVQARTPKLPSRLVPPDSANIPALSRKNLFVFSAFSRGNSGFLILHF